MSLHLSKCHIVGNHMSWLNSIVRFGPSFCRFSCFAFVLEGIIVEWCWWHLQLTCYLSG